MGLIARSILGPILGPLALTLGTNIFNKNPNITKGLGFFNQDGSDKPPIGPGINLTQEQIYDMDDVDPADYGLVDAATADIQDFADIMPENIVILVAVLKEQMLELLIFKTMPIYARRQQ